MKSVNFLGQFDLEELYSHPA